MPVAVACRTCARRSPRAQRPRPDLGERWPSRLVATAEEDRVSTTIERWCGGRALPWHRVDVGFFGAHALSRYTRVARMDSCDPLLATHFLLEKQVEARIPGCPVRSRAARLVATATEDRLKHLAH